MMPAPRRSATSMTSSRASRAPSPTSIATLVPALRTSAARASSSSGGVMLVDVWPTPVRDTQCSSAGSSMSRSWTSAGRMTTVGFR